LELPCGLASLAKNSFFEILHAFALIGFWRTKTPNLGSVCTEQLLVDTGQNDDVFFDFGGNALGHIVDHWMGEAKLKSHLLTGNLGSVTNAVDLKPALETLADSMNHVGHQSTHQTVGSSRWTAVVSALEDDLSLTLGNVHEIVSLGCKFPFGALHRDHWPKSNIDSLG